MEPIKDTIARVLEGLVEKKTGIKGADPEKALKKTLTKKELGHIRFNYFKKGIMGLSVDSSGWLYNFNFKKEGLLKKLQKHLPDALDVRFRIGDKQ